MDKMLSKIEMLNEIGIALSADISSVSVLELILRGAQQLTNADGGTLYTLNEQQQLIFQIVSTQSLDIYMGGNSGHAIEFPPLPLYVNGKENHSMVVTSAVINAQAINISDAYHAEGYDFSGTRKFDESTGYRTRSILTIPMTNHKAEIIGVLQLINSTDKDTGEVIDFSREDQKLAESLASQAAVALTNKKLIDEQKALFESFIKLIATAVDEKSPYTGGHCRRLPELTMMIADACHRDNSGPLKHFEMTDNDRYALMIAGWLHDCGKVTTPEHVIDKATKLQTIYDRIETINTRFNGLKQTAKINLLEAVLQARILNDLQAQKQAEKQAEKTYHQQIKKIDDDIAFIANVNIGGEYMDEKDQQRVAAIAAINYVDHQGVAQNFLSEDEVKNLSVSRGTLTSEEREIINNHIVVTIKMLDQLPFPRHLEHVPEYAGGHHERMDGRGYPKGLKRDEMSWQARMMGVADIFEALTAQDRPYKDGKKLSECLQILGKMKLDNHIDPEVFDIFVRDKIYLQYAREFLPNEQIDEVDHEKIPGYQSS